MIAYLKALGVSVIAVLAPTKQMVLTMLVLVMVDLITGLMAAYKQGKTITSAGIRRSISKAIVFTMAIWLAFITQQYLVSDIEVCKMVAGAIGLAELLSCLENINILAGGSILKIILKRIGSANDNI